MTRHYSLDALDNPIWLKSSWLDSQVLDEDFDSQVLDEDFDTLDIAQVTAHFIEDAGLTDGQRRMYDASWFRVRGDRYARL
jgi:hypothetical protein